MLGEAFERLKRKASLGIDGMTHAEYAKDLDAHLEDLEARLKTGRYRARDVKRRWIAKPGGRKRRPLGITVLEDKIVQQAVKMILEAIWEADFVDESIGYRPGRGARQSSLELRETLHKAPTYRWVVEADIRSFFETERDARAYLRALPKRLGKFGLQMAEEKSALVKFNRWEPDDSGKFTFLGFDFYWARTRRNPNYVVIKRRTNRAKFRASLLAFKEWLKRSRSLKLRDLLAVLRRKLQGYWNYYGVLGNSMMLAKYQWEVYRLIYKWLNRRSQRRSLTWKQLMERWARWRMPPPRVVERPLKPGLA